MAQTNHNRPILDIRDLHVSVGDNEILRGMDLSVSLGEVHAIMGPNGSGKSTFTNVVAGRPGYTITSGEIIYEGESILGMFPDERARKGIFLALQYPVELPGIRNREFLRTALEALREARGETKLAVREFNKFLGEGQGDGLRTRPDEAQCERGLLRRRKETQRDPPDVRPRPQARPPGRDRLGPRHRRSKGRLQGSERVPRAS